MSPQGTPIAGWAAASPTVVTTARVLGGPATAGCLPSEGGRLVLVDVDRNGVAKLSGELGGVPVQVEVTRGADVAAARPTHPPLGVERLNSGGQA